MSTQVAVVTGAAGGFGRAITKSFIAVGYHVVATDLDRNALEELNHWLGSPQNITCMSMDVVDIESIEAVARHVETTVSNSMTVLVNNAGIIDKNFCLNENSLAIAKKIIDVNLTGCFNCASIFSKYMAKLRYGRIINIASVAGIWGAAGASAYAASKAGLIKASESWARELGPLNVSVTAVAPGICKTNMFGQFLDEDKVPSPEEDKIVKSIVPVGRLGSPDDVAEVVTFLATCKTNYLNATVIEMDGGMRVGAL